IQQFIQQDDPPSIQRLESLSRCLRDADQLQVDRLKAPRGRFRECHPLLSSFKLSSPSWASTLGGAPESRPASLCSVRVSAYPPHRSRPRYPLGSSLPRFR